MILTDSVALVTGANRGLGARLVTELLRAGAAKVYATSRTPAAPASVGADSRVRPLVLDITGRKPPRARVQFDQPGM